MHLHASVEDHSCQTIRPNGKEPRTKALLTLPLYSQPTQKEATLGNPIFSWLSLQYCVHHDGCYGLWWQFYGPPCWTGDSEILPRERVYVCVLPSTSPSVPKRSDRVPPGRSFLSQPATPHATCFPQVGSALGSLSRSLASSPMRLGDGHAVHAYPN